MKKRSSEAELLRGIFDILAKRTGRDFSRYKISTVRRRIDRRIAAHHLPSLEAYAALLRRQPGEVTELFSSLLIGVTSFFRDRSVMRLLQEKVIPSLCDERQDGVPLRIWVPGCSTGEEAYSLAILLREHMAVTGKEYPFSLFATDLDAAAIETARRGLFPADIAKEVSGQRLRKFFDRKEDGYQVRKEVRDAVIFAVQDIVKDPPFSRLDLISCRNLLIYLEHDLQAKVFVDFHYALNPGGYLLLGTSETPGDYAELFETVDLRCRLYRNREVDAATCPQPARWSVPPLQAPATPAAKKGAPLEPVSYQRLVENLLLENLPASLIVNRKGDILYIHGQAGRYLETPPGPANFNVLTMAKAAVRTALTGAIGKAIAGNREVRCSGLRVRLGTRTRAVSLTVRPLQERSLAPGLLLVSFSEQGAAVDVPVQEKQGAAHEGRVRSLEKELKTTRDYLRRTVEQLETANEELKSTNEELQSANEELQSSNEELETSREEMQSINEELSTVNTELQRKIDELSKANSDIRNLVGGTDIGTVFLDGELRVKLFTPSSTAIFRLLKRDIGRPLSDIVSFLQYDRIFEEARRVLETLVPFAAEVQTRNGNWYAMRILPYRTTENAVDGLVLTFVDVTERTSAWEALRESENLNRAIVTSAGEGVVVYDTKLRIVLWNRFMEKMMGIRAEQVLGQHVYEALPELREIHLEKLLRSVLKGGHVDNFEAAVTRPSDGQELWSLRSYRPLVGSDGRVQGVVGSVMDITDRKCAEQATLQERDRARQYLDIAGVIILALDEEARVTLANREACAVLDREENEILGRNWFETFVPPPDGPRILQFHRDLMSGALTRPDQFYTENAVIAKTGEHRLISWRTVCLRDGSGRITGTLSSGEDITERRRAEEALRESEARFRLLAENATDIIIRHSTKQGVINYISPSCRAILGYEPEEMVGHSPYEYMPPEDADKVRQLQQVMLEQRTPFVFTTRMRRKDGEYTWFETWGRNIRDPETDAAIEVHTTSREITDRLRAEEALRESEARFRLLAENATDIIMRHSTKDGTLTYVSPACRTVLGYEPEELVGHTPYYFIVPEDAEKVRCLQHDMVTQRTPFMFTVRLRRKDGGFVWAETRGRAIRDPKTDEAVEIHTATRDVTERVRAEEALRESEARFRLLAENATDVISRHAPDWKFLYLSPACRRMGYEPDELVGASPFDLVHPDDLAAVERETASLLERDNSTVSIIYRLRARNGEYVWYESAMRAIRDPLSGDIVEVHAVSRDITERRRAGEALRVSEARLRTLINAMQDIVCFKDGEGRWLEANEFDLRLFHLEGVDYRGKKDSELAPFSPGFRDAFLACEGTDEQSWKKGVPSRNDEVIPGPDGDERVFDVIKVPTFSPDGSREGLVVVGRDITERKQAEEALRESETRYRTYVDNAPNGIVLTDAAAFCLDVNPEICRITGYSREEMLKLRVGDFHATIQEKQDPIFQDTMEKGSASGEVLCRRKNGELFWLAVNAVRLPDGRCLGFVQDVTAQKEAEKALRENREFLSNIFSSIQDGISIVDRDFTIVQVNETFEKWYPQSMPLVGKKCYAAYHDRTSPCEGCYAMKTLETKKSFSQVKQTTSLGNGWIELHSFPLYNVETGETNGIIQYARDITARKRAEEEKERLQKQLIHSEKIAGIGTLAAGVAHEFNNFIQIMRGHAEFARDTGEVEEMKESLGIVLETCDKAGKIVKDLLAFSRRDSSAGMETCLLTEPLETVLGLVEDHLRKQNIAVIRRFEAVPPFPLSKTEMQQVFLNLVTNARDAMLPKGGELEIAVIPAPGAVVVKVRDTGKGIPKENLGKIFDAFFTTKGILGGGRKKGHGEEGTGLGLSISYAIIHRHGGTIDVESEVGKGTVFTLRFPVPAATAAIAAPPPREERAAAPVPRRVLVLDDEQEIGNMIIRSLSADGHAVTHVADASSAERLLQAGGIDYLFLDMVMPGSSGDDFIETALRLSPATKIVIITGKLLDDETRSALRQRGVHDLLQKPFRLADLGTIVR